jgi:hypothetical protein
MTFKHMVTDLFYDYVSISIQEFLCLLCTTVLYEYINSLGNDVCNLFVNTHERIKIYREFYHCIIYIANEGRIVEQLASNNNDSLTHSIHHFTINKLKKIYILGYFTSVRIILISIYP